MAPTVHIIDPDPDTIIVLKNPCKVFAPWELEEERRNSTISEVPVPSDDVDHPQPLSPSPLQEPALVETPADSSMYALDEGSTALTEPSSGVQSPVLPEEPEEESIHYHVSSRHLILASATFKRMLAQDGFAESVRNEADGLYHITAHDWDAEAFLIVLRIVHGRNKLIPRKQSLEMLAKIAVLEDYYNFGETLETFTEMWIQELTKTPIPQTHGRDLVLWIWVAWVFDMEQQFTNATATSIGQITESFPTLDLPIPARVSDEIDSRRYLAIESLLEGLYKRLEIYRQTDYTCPYSNDSHSFLCSSFLLGSLMKELSRLGLDQPRPEVPFHDMSFSTLCGQVQSMNSAEWYHLARAKHPCNLRVALQDLITDASGTIGGLSLSELKHR